MTDTITLTGLVGTEPKHTVTSAGLDITNFRLASTQRRFDRAQNAWVDGDTNWYTISAFRQLAVNAAASIKKGERIVVTGRLRLRDWQTAEKSGMTIDIEADAIGHDLSWGTTQWTRTSRSSGSSAEQTQDAGSSAVTGDDSGAEQPSGPDQWSSPSSSARPSDSDAAGSSAGRDDEQEDSLRDRATVFAGASEETPF